MSWNAPAVRYDNFYARIPVKVLDGDLLPLLSKHPTPLCDLSTCAGKECQLKKSHGTWSPVTFSDGTSRKNENVISVNYLVADLDHLSDDAIEVVLAGIEGYAWALYSTHRHAPPNDGAYRLVIPLSRPVPAAEWREFRAAAVEYLGLPADPQTKDLARIYALPDSRLGQAPTTRQNDGIYIDVDAFGATATLTTTPTAASPESHDIGEARARLAKVRGSKARGDGNSKDQAEILGKLLDGIALAEPGARDATLLRACSLMAFHLPAGFPWVAALEILRLSLEAMSQPEGLDHWIDEACDMYARSQANRAAQDAARAEEDAKIREIAKSIRDRSAVSIATSGPGDEPPDDWESLLLTTKEGVRACEMNAQILLACAPELRGNLRWNVVEKRIEVLDGPLADESPSTLPSAAAAWLQMHYKFQGGSSIVKDALLQVARKNPHDPITEYLGELLWDGETRLDIFLERYLGVTTSEYVRAVSRRWLISLVARALRPGCKVDTVLILEGAQGAGKSSVLEALVGSRYFLDTALELGSKDTMQAIASAWLVELGELASFNRAEVGKTRQFITSKVDKFRAPYSPAIEESPRRCVLVGSTNDERYLTDATGNRRYWPVRVGTVEIKAVERDRGQILAEAVAAFRASERWWLTGTETVYAEHETSARFQESPMQEAIARWWYGMQPNKRPARLGILDVLQTALSMSARDLVDKRTQIEAGLVLKRLGFQVTGRRRVDGCQVRQYEPTAEMLSAPMENLASLQRGLELVRKATEKP